MIQEQSSYLRFERLTLETMNDCCAPFLHCFVYTGVLFSVLVPAPERGTTLINDARLRPPPLIPWTIDHFCQRMALKETLVTQAVSKIRQSSRKNFDMQKTEDIAHSLYNADEGFT
jgi:hypothetical protein